MPKIKFLLAIHSHQPVGNFEGVFQEAYEKAYLPFLDVISKYPEVKLALHYSGGLLDWLEKKYPDFIQRLRNLVSRGQIEILAGGYYEPILPIIPESDALGQIEMLKKKIEKLFSYQAKGAWLTERVWEPRTAYILSKGGLKYTLVDDAHFKFVSSSPDDVEGYYICDEQGEHICIFPGCEKLRYAIPFKLPPETIDYFKMRLERSKKDLAITFADDGEKFGLWPGTHKWVYKEKWLENFFDLLSRNRDWIEFQTFSDYLNENPPSGKIYLACASYREMLEWSEGYFRNFFIKYPEADNMQKRMFYVSNKLKNYAERLNKKDFEKARDYLYKAEANDSYWHGVFGGLYLNHLRSAVYSNLIEAEKIIDRLDIKNEERTEELDINLDGRKEIIINNEVHALYFMPSRQAALYEWDYKPKAINFTNTIMRRPEKYHQRLKEKLEMANTSNSSIPSIHEISAVKEKISAQELYYDAYPRYSLIEHFFTPDSDLDNFISSNMAEIIPALSRNSKADYTHALAKVVFSYNVVADKLYLDIVKSVQVTRDLKINYKLRNLSDAKSSLNFGIEFNFSLYDPNLSINKGILKKDSLNINDVWYGINLTFDLSEDALIWHFPVETISESEAGIEKTYQGLCLVFIWNLDIPAKDARKLDLNLSVN
ncbi:MAG: DUF1926 domain-containing protein [Candidatus Omnitrophica bacterium]|nr:DUF1926 domain-containing protein [Candidatus Omnitrophota bacterium]